ncbi:MAG: VOC family protein [Nitriliruptorales bacterium]|nr:VOC family protein [Nitriliruptorales bacterium]
MAVRLYSVVIDSRDHASLARWWAAALGWRLVYEDDNEAALAQDEGSEPALVFVPVPESKQVKNRLHIDLAPDDQEAEVRRLLDLGAQRADIGQGEQTWVVLQDPEGNEFCVLSAR